MRIMYKKDNGMIVGIIYGRVTGHIPPSGIDGVTDYRDFDYNEEKLQHSHFCRYINQQGKGLIGKKMIFNLEGLARIESLSSQPISPCEDCSY